MSGCRRDAKLCTAEEALGLVENSQTVASGGFVGAGVPEALVHALEQRFLDNGSPQDLTVIYAAGQGDGKDRGINHLAHEGLVRRVIGGHWGLAPRMSRLALDNKIEAYNFPQGVICQLFRDIAAGRPGCITHVGLDTFIDPAHQGGRGNECTVEELVERVELGGKIWLWYKSIPVHVGLIRATAADPNGNLVMHEEGLLGEMLPIAQAAHNSGGRVIAQVSRLMDEPARPQDVRIPGILVDHIIVAEPHHHPQTFAAADFNPALVSPAAINEPLSPFDSELSAIERLGSGPRRIIASRACDEVPEGAIANLGIGMPEGIAAIAAERGLLKSFTLTVESGPIGGAPAGGLGFGVSVNPEAIIDQPSQFDFYDGKGLDFAALGAAEIDRKGNVNVSRFGSRMAGVGGFVNITQTARRLVFCGTFTSGGLVVAVEDTPDGKVLRIVKEGRHSKFVEEVEQLSFNGCRSRGVGQDVRYVTERAVFRLADEGVELIEIAPGVDLQAQVLDLLPFTPICRNVRPMPEHVFF